MARAKSEFVSAAGTANEIIKRLAHAVYDSGGSDDDLRRILSDDDLANDLAKRILKQSVAEWTGEVYKVTVRPMPWQNRLGALGCEYVNPEFTEANFPMRVEAEMERDFVLLYLNRYATTKEVEAEIARFGLEPADDVDLVTFGSHPKYRDLQRQFPIVALGSRARSSSGSVVVPVLSGFAYERDLYLCYFGARRWGGDCRFLCRRKLAAKAAE